MVAVVVMVILQQTYISGDGGCGGIKVKVNNFYSDNYYNSCSGVEWRPVYKNHGDYLGGDNYDNF